MSTTNDTPWHGKSVIEQLAERNAEVDTLTAANAKLTADLAAAESRIAAADAHTKDAEAKLAIVRGDAPATTLAELKLRHPACAAAPAAARPPLPTAGLTGIARAIAANKNHSAK